MLGPVIVRPVYMDRDRSEEIIASGKPWFCQDWSCPRREYCGRHYGLSEPYAAMDEAMPGKFALVMPDRGDDGCGHYRPATRDYFAESLGQRRTFSPVEGTA